MRCVTILLALLMSITMYAEDATVYSWSSDGVVSQMGGEMKQYGSRINRINTECSGYYVVALVGKRENINDGTATQDATYMEITLSGAEKFHKGDKVKVTAMRNTTEMTANATLYMLFGNGAEITDGNVWNNLGLLNEVTIGGETSSCKAVNGEAPVQNTDDAGVEDLRFISLEPNTNVFAVPDEAEGASTLKLTRDVSECRLYVVKIEVVRENGVDAVETVTQCVKYEAPRKTIGKNGCLTIGNYNACGQRLK